MTGGLFMLQTRHELKRCAAGDTDENGTGNKGDTLKTERRTR